MRFWMLLALLVCPMLSGAAQASGVAMFPSLGVSDKPQSKLWYHDGSWWAAMNGMDRIGIYELLPDSTWAERDSVGPPAPPVLMGGTTDVLWDGTELYIAAFDSVAARLYKHSYIDSTRDYVPVAGFPISIPTGAGSETVAIAKDSTGRLWAACEANFQIELRYSTTSDTTWAGPIVLGTFVNPDDICAILAFDGKVGVMWSNQSDWAFYFRSHNDIDPPGVWSPTETVMEGVQLADDHISLAADSTGRVYSAMKDQDDHLLFARRDLDGSYQTNTDVLYGRYGTRPIVLVDDFESKVYCFYTRWPTGSHVGTNWIEYRVANYNTLVFGVETVFIGDGQTVSMNNIQSTKQRLSPGSLVALCQGDDGQAYWSGWGPLSGIGGTGGGGQLPAPPGSPSAPVTTMHQAPGGTLGLAAFTFEEGSGTTSADASGNGHLAILETGATPEWTSGITGGGLRFNGINDLVRVDDPGDLALTGGFTVECWVQLHVEPDKMGLVNKGTTDDRNYRLMVTRSGSIEFSYKDTAGIAYAAETSGVITDFDWHHAAGVVDPESLQVRVYLDGQYMGQTPMGGPPATSAAPVLLGARNTSVIKDYLRGSLDQVRISSTVVYTEAFSPPVAFTTNPTNYTRLTWTPPEDAQGGVSGYNVFRSINGSESERVSGLSLVISTEFADASVLDGFVTYTVNAVDQLGQHGAQSAPTQMEFESYEPMLPEAPRDFAVSRHSTAGGVVAAYPLDENGGQLVLDVGGNAIHGQLGPYQAPEASDPIWVPGISGSALEFDGINDRVKIAHKPALSIPGSMTIEAWFQLAELGLDCAILGKGQSSERNYRIVVEASGEIEWSFAATTGSTRKLRSSIEVTDLAWHHVSCVYDAEGGEMRIYLDGVLAGSTAATGTPSTNTDALHIGVRQSSSSLKEWFKGRIDLVQIAAQAVRTEDFTPLTTPGLAPGPGYVSTRWTIPQYGLVYGYNIYRSVDGQMDWLLNRTGLLTGTTYTDDRPHAGQNCYWVRALNAHGDEGVPTPVGCVDFTPGEAPTDVAERTPRRGLGLRVAPNPFNPTTRVFFHLTQKSNVDLALFDVSGRRVRSWTLVDVPPGEHYVPLHAENHQGRLGSGIYFLRLKAGTREAHTRFVLLK